MKRNTRLEKVHHEKQREREGDKQRNKQRQEKQDRES